MAAEPKTFDIASYAKRLPNGSIDVQGTHLQFTQDLSSLVATEKTDNEVIAQAVEKAFKDRKVSNLGMLAVLHYAMENLDVPADSFNTIRDRVAGYIRSNTRSYKVSKGKGGGVHWLQNDETHAATPTASVSPAPSSGSMRPRQHA